MSALEYTNEENVNFLLLIKNVIICIDRVPKICMDMYETNIKCAKTSLIFFDYIWF